MGGAVGRGHGKGSTLGSGFLHILAVAVKGAGALVFARSAVTITATVAIIGALDIGLATAIGLAATIGNLVRIANAIAATEAFIHSPVDQGT